MADPLACGDLIAERRFAYAKAAAEEGDWRAAAEVLLQVLERAPHWAAAWFALGEAREKLGDVDEAAHAFRSTLIADSSDAHGATARLALIGRGEAPRALPAAYVARLFDDYAPRFDAHLIENLAYRGPALIADALDSAAPGLRFARALDIGCGTGLMGQAVHGRVDHLIGVDLSPAMIAKTRERGVYDALEVGNATSFLNRSAPRAFDCILAADALCYFGDLRPVFAAGARALSKAGLFAFSIETFEGDGYRLDRTMRFAHAPPYVETAARDADLRPLLVRPASTRREAGEDVRGLICVFEGPTRLGRNEFWHDSLGKRKFFSTLPDLSFEKARSNLALVPLRSRGPGLERIGIGLDSQISASLAGRIGAMSTVPTARSGAPKALLHPAAAGAP